MDLCIRNDEFCSRNDEFCSKTDAFLIQNHGIWHRDCERRPVIAVPRGGQSPSAVVGMVLDAPHVQLHSGRHIRPPIPRLRFHRRQDLLLKLRPAFMKLVLPFYILKNPTSIREKVHSVHLSMQFHHFSIEIHHFPIETSSFFKNRKSLISHLCR